MEFGPAFPDVPVARQRLSAIRLSSTTGPCWRSRIIVACTTWVGKRGKIRTEFVDAEFMQSILYVKATATREHLSCVGYLAKSCFFRGRHKNTPKSVVISTKDAFSFFHDTAIHFSGMYGNKG